MSLFLFDFPYQIPNDYRDCSGYHARDESGSEIVDGQELPSDYIVNTFFEIAFKFMSNLFRH